MSNAAVLQTIKLICNLTHVGSPIYFMYESNFVYMNNPTGMFRMLSENIDGDAGELVSGPTAAADSLCN